MRFLKPEILWHLLWILPAMLVLFFAASHKTARTLQAFLGKNAENPDYVLFSKGRRILRFVLLCLAVLCLVAAAARPSWGVQIQELNGQGRDLLFVFDVSRSMLAKDVQPSRLAHAKWLVKELVKLNPGDRFGLIAFAGKGFLECPLTTDRTSFELSLDELSTDSIPLGGTNIQEALAAALQAFKAAETSHRAVILVTDGDELEGNSGKAVDEIVARKIPLFIAGIGDPSQPSIIQVPDGRGGVKTLTDANGNVVNSPLNEKQLGELAKRTGGIYVRSTAGDSGLGALEKRIRALAPHEYETVKTTKPIDRFGYPLAAAFVLLLLCFMVGERPAHRKLAACMLFAFCLAVSGAEEAVPAAEESFNKGVEAHEKNDLKTASESYETALRTGVGQAEIRGRATQNLGVIAHAKARSELAASLQAVQGQNLDEAQKQVENSLKTLNRAEGMYLDSMRESAERNQLAKNQSILLADRKRAEELKKKIEELKKMQQQAQQQTQQAKDQQKKENQKPQEQQNQDKQNQQGQQDKQNQQGKQDKQNQQGKQDRQNQQNQNRQSAQQMTDQAKKSAEELQKKAQEMGQQNLAKSAEQAKKELEKAQQEQKQGKGESAEEHLKKALDALGGEQSGKDKQDKQQGEQGRKDGAGKDQKPEPQSGKDGGDGQKEDRKIEQPQPRSAEKKPEEGDIDKNQAASVLEEMAKDEKDLRDAIKAFRKQRYKNTAPAKDW
ncbi:MAG: VWA domain-containing protein [Victivallales bacterium]|nr:VWA domain-containing protein [Victivallales bacterium]